MLDRFRSLFCRTPPKSEAEKPALKPADKNPWYCLATIHGEQPMKGFDDDVARKNQQVWSKWVGRALNAQGDERTEFERDFAKRSGGSLKIPDPNAIVDFSNTHFICSVNFLDFQFPRAIDFSSATFSGEAKFVGANFSSKADFTSATFSGEANFRTAQFHTVGVDFRTATFCKRVDFQYAVLVDPNFSSVAFSDYANFRSAKFSGDKAAFLSATFCNGADFGSAEFINGIADFSRATFAEAVIFNAAKFNIASFKAATFSKPITFINTTFTGSTNFAHARFETQAPDFRGAKMHEATEWHAVTWPNPPRNKDDAQQQVYVYERLKQEMERLKKHEDEQKFFRMELRARRRLLWTSPGEWLLNFGYQALSDYGHSFTKPLLWLLGVFVAGATFFALAPVYCGAPMSTDRAAWLSIASVLIFLPTKRELMTEKMVECLSDSAQIVSVVQSLLGVVLLFLLGLALRNRFRMR
jgi:uncharacterized protein YjbI with pentapeptide repeats